MHTYTLLSGTMCYCHLKWNTLPTHVFYFHLAYKLVRYHKSSIILSFGFIPYFSLIHLIPILLIISSQYFSSAFYITWITLFPFIILFLRYKIIAASFCVTLPLAHIPATPSLHFLSEPFRFLLSSHLYSAISPSQMHSIKQWIISSFHVYFMLTWKWMEAVVTWDGTFWVVSSDLDDITQYNFFQLY